MSLHYTVTDDFAHSKFCHTFFYTQMFGMQMFLHRTIFTNIYIFQQNRFLHADALMGIFVFGKQKSIHTQAPLQTDWFFMVLHAESLDAQMFVHTHVLTQKIHAKPFTHRCLLLHTFPHTKKTKGVFTLKMFLLYTRTVYIRILPAQLLIFSRSTRSSWGRVRRAQATSQIYLNLR